MINILFSSDWHKACHVLELAQLLETPTSRIRQTADGQFLDLFPNGAPWEHFWWTAPSWDGKQWTVQVLPGLVHALDPTVPGVKNDDGGEASLADFPQIPLHAFRAGLDNETGEVKNFFLARGVKLTESDLHIDTNTGNVQFIERQQANADLPPCQLRAVDLYLAQARPSLRAQINPVDASGISGLIVDYSATLDTTNLEQKGARCRLQQAPQYPAVVKPSLEDRLMGNYEDEGEDRHPISTVFLVSPPDATGEPDGSWTPYVQHQEFWNLRHGTPNVTPAKPYQPIRLFTGLAGGFGDIIINGYLGLQNTLTDQLLSAIQNTTPEGRFEIA